MTLRNFLERPISPKLFRKLLGIANGQLLPCAAMVATVDDPANKSAYEYLIFQKIDASYHSVLVPREDVRQIPKLRDLLLKRGANLPRDTVELGKLMDALVKTEPRMNAACVGKVGWLPRGNGFSMHDRIIGPEATLYPPMPAEKPVFQVSHKGDMLTWVRDVATPAEYSCTLMLVLSAAFAPPLLKAVGKGSFGINLFGPPKKGKTTAVLAAASVIGFGREEDLMKWGGTNVGFQALPAMFNDHLLVIDEVMLVDGESPKAISKNLRGVAYQLASGRDKIRHPKSDYSVSADQATSRTILLTSSEKSLQAIAEQAGETRSGGEKSRFHDVPAFRPKRQTIFDRFPDDCDHKKRWARATLVALRRACEANHGVALEPFIEHVVAIGAEKITTIARRATDQFVGDVKAHIATEDDEHAAENFGLIYAAGLLAIDAKLLPIRKSRLLTSISTCFMESVAGQSTVTAVEAAAIAALTNGINAAQWVKPNQVADDGRPCFVKIGTVDEATIFAVNPRAFQKWFASVVHMQAAVRWLDRKGQMMLPGKIELSRRANFGRNTISTSPRINERQFRSIQFTWPKG